MMDWSPETSESASVSDDLDDEPESETSNPYEPDDFGRYTVSTTGSGRRQCNLGTPVLDSLGAEPGDIVRVIDHEDGLLLEVADD